MTFTDTLWKQIAPTYSKILQHPFNVELASGVLDYDRFTFYLEQDVLYLRALAKSLSLMASRSSLKYIAHFLTFARESMACEQQILSEFLPAHLDIEAIRPSPACFAYTHHILAIASSAPEEEFVTAILPCFWTYLQLGRELKMSANNLYSKWIDTYTCEEASISVGNARAIVDEIAKKATPSVLKRMSKAFIYGAHYELQFWHDAHRKALFLSY
jgi:thiaminase/transcriptional activator TenA